MEKYRLRKRFEFEAERPQFSTLIRHVQLACFSFLCENKDFFFSFFRDDDYSAKLSTEMRRHNEQIIPLKFSASACKFLRQINMLVDLTLFKKYGGGKLPRRVWQCTNVVFAVEICPSCSAECKQRSIVGTRNRCQELKF